MSDDGSRLIVMDTGSTVVIDLRPEEWTKRICHLIAGREMTPDDVVGLPALSKTGTLCSR